MKSIIPGLVLFVIAGLAQAQTIEEQIGQGLEMQNIEAINKDNGTLRVVTKTLQLTEQRYHEVIAGVCPGLAGGAEELQNISEIRVLNAFSKQGFAFQGGAKECRELDELPENESGSYISSISRKVRN